MVRNILVKILLSPFTLLYGIVMWLRNYFYQKGILRSVEFDIPIISVGNLSVGGAGKTPHVEYLIRLLSPYLQMATLSRGYRRKTKGYLNVLPNTNALQVGDEPLQYKRKYPHVKVTVGEDRVYSIPQIISEKGDTQVVVLDDAFQHRAVKPGLNILLTEYSHPFTKDILLPSGRLREWRSSYKRADVIIVTKCPAIMTQADAGRFREEIKPLPHQHLYFSYYDYGSPYFIFNPKYATTFQDDWDVILVSAIARTDYLVDYLKSQVNSVYVFEFEDHHYFDASNMWDIKTVLENVESDKKLIITTEKDAMRLELHKDFIIQNKLPLFVLPVEVKFHFQKGEHFDQNVKDFLLNFKV